MPLWREIGLCIALLPPWRCATGKAAPGPTDRLVVPPRGSPMPERFEPCRSNALSRPLSPMPTVRDLLRPWRAVLVLALPRFWPGAPFSTPPVLTVPLDRRSPPVDHLRWALSLALVAGLASPRRRLIDRHGGTGLRSARCSPPWAWSRWFCRASGRLSRSLMLLGLATAASFMIRPATFGRIFGHRAARRSRAHARRRLRLDREAGPT